MFRCCGPEDDVEAEEDRDEGLAPGEEVLVGEEDESRPRRAERFCSLAVEVAELDRPRPVGEWFGVSGFGLEAMLAAKSDAERVR
jgi:hypothetical protein